MFDPFDTLRPVFTPDPVNRHHPIHRGLVAWWLPLPGLEGGRQWFDLLGKYHAPVSNPSPRWGADPIGIGRTFQRADAAFSVTGPNNAIPSSSPLSLALWCAPQNATNTFLGVGDFSNDGARLGVVGGTQPKFSLILTSPSTAQEDLAASGATTLGAPQHVVGTWDPATGIQAIFVNGVPAGSRTSTRTVMRTGAAPFYMGNDSLGIVYSQWAWSRALSASEIRAHYDLSRLGYPGLLRRWPQAAMTAAAAPPPPPGTSGKPVRWFPGLARPVRVRPRMRAR